MSRLHSIPATLNVAAGLLELAVVGALVICFSALVLWALWAWGAST